MNDGLKQRLVGAVVLLSLALILWPVIFSDPNGPALDRRSQIPPMPAFEKYSVPEPVRVQDVEPISRPSMAEQTPVIDKPVAKSFEQKSVIKPKPKPRPKLDKKGLPEAWVLQVASFTQQKNADELTLQLQKKGHKAFARSITTKEGKSTRVYIGPRMTKNAFDKDKKTIDKAYSVTSMVLRFDQ